MFLYKHKCTVSHIWTTNLNWLFGLTKKHFTVVTFFYLGCFLISYKNSLKLEVKCGRPLCFENCYTPKFGKKTEKTQTLKHLRSCKVKPRQHLRSQYHEKIILWNKLFSWQMILFGKVNLVHLSYSFSTAT